MKTRSLLSLFACAALAVTLAGCGSSDDKAAAPAATKSAPGPADVARTVCAALVSGDYKAFIENSAGEGLPDKESFELMSSMMKAAGAKFTVGAVRMEGDTAYVKTTLAAPGKDPHEDELEVRKVDGVWKAFSGADD